MLDQAFEALKKFDYGTPLSDIQAIEDAVVASNKDEAARKAIEQRLIQALGSPISRDAKDYICRQLALVGSAASVPAVARLLANEGNAHLARHALERIPGVEAEAALASAAKSLTGKLQLGAIGSLGVCGKSVAIATLANLLSHTDSAVVRGAALSLGAIGGVEAANALQSAMKAVRGDKNLMIDALLSCAESLLKQKKSKEATAIYSALAEDNQPRLVRLAAARGLLACAGA
ncbi:MAG: HEAT repeat domain-containing protein [Pirellula sp.]|nr:HEAT repeat domain-containing protein [Pirellula sp.]